MPGHPAAPEDSLGQLQLDHRPRHRPPDDPHHPCSGMSAPSDQPSAKPMARPTPAEIEARIPAGLRPLRYVGIPSSVLAWKPRLPSRNWSIFLLTVGTLTYLYVDDRRQVRFIQDEYKARVASLGERPLAPSQWPRKIAVYACKAPGDEDYDKGVLWFKRYMKVRTLRHASHRCSLHPLLTLHLLLPPPPPRHCLYFCVCLLIRL